MEKSRDDDSDETEGRALYLLRPRTQARFDQADDPAAGQRQLYRHRSADIFGRKPHRQRFRDERDDGPGGSRGVDIDGMGGASRLMGTAMTIYPSELQKIFEEDERRKAGRPFTPARTFFYECDCGRRFENLDALYSCQGAGHC